MNVDLDSLTDAQHWELSDLVINQATHIASNVINEGRGVDFLLANGWTKEDIINALKEKS